MEPGGFRETIMFCINKVESNWKGFHMFIVREFPQ